MSVRKISTRYIVFFVLTAILSAGCAKTASHMPHPIEGYESCNECHEPGIAGAPKTPHPDRENCTACHKPKS